MGQITQMSIFFICSHIIETHVLYPIVVKLFLNNYPNIVYLAIYRSNPLLSMSANAKRMPVSRQFSFWLVSCSNCLSTFLLLGVEPSNFALVFCTT